jgi:hypothetical protein
MHVGSGSGFTVLEENGKGMNRGSYYDVVAMTRKGETPSETAVGQSRNGEWLIVNY